MHVTVTGASGILGTPIVAALRADGHRVTRLVRRPPAAPDEARWDPDSGILDPEALRGVDAVVHLAGEHIGARRATGERKRRMRDSRVDGTRLVASAMARMDDGPRVLLCASGTNYYGDRGADVLTEDDPPGSGFMADLVRDWEAAADSARAAGVRVAHLRMGIVLTPDGGSLAPLLLLFRFGLGGPFGSGRQYWSWVGIEDVIGAFRHALSDDTLSGPVNVVAPEAVTNEEFSRTLGRVLRRPAFLRVPRFGPRLVVGRDLADDLLFASMRVAPCRLLEHGYRFVHADLEACLRAQFGRTS